MALLCSRWPCVLQGCVCRDASVLLLCARQCLGKLIPYPATKPVKPALSRACDSDSEMKWASTTSGICSLHSRVSASDFRAFLFLSFFSPTRCMTAWSKAWPHPQRFSVFRTASRLCCAKIAWRDFKTPERHTSQPGKTTWESSAADLLERLKCRQCCGNSGKSMQNEQQLNEDQLGCKRRKLLLSNPFDYRAASAQISHGLPLLCADVGAVNQDCQKLSPSQTPSLGLVSV